MKKNASDDDDKDAEVHADAEDSDGTDDFFSDYLAEILRDEQSNGARSSATQHEGGAAINSLVGFFRRRTGWTEERTMVSTNAFLEQYREQNALDNRSLEEVARMLIDERIPFGIYTRDPKHKMKRRPSGMRYKKRTRETTSDDVSSD